MEFLYSVIMYVIRSTVVLLGYVFVTVFYLWELLNVRYCMLWDAATYFYLNINHLTIS